jgi:hypothetical protein
MRLIHAAEPAPGAGVSEDCVLTGPDFALVVDGATASGRETGCRHDVAWFARRLTAALGALLLTGGTAPLPELLRAAITEVRAAHPQCDLGNRDSPSATVAAVRAAAGRLDVLVLADSPVLVETADGALHVLSDDRLDRLPAYDAASVAALRNHPDGFWVASTDPGAADQALTRSFPLDSVRRFAVLSDGVSRLSEHFGLSWQALLDLLDVSGPAAAIAAVRARERALAPGEFTGKRHDDATAVFGRP